MDYAISEALRRFIEERTLPSAIVLYDIVCQWHIHYRERVTKNSGHHLYIPPDDVDILYAIGLFHVHGHQASCYPRFAPSFTPGAGMLDGETIETLWSILKGIAGSTRTMATSHRKEVIDDHMNDLNWEKNGRLGAPSFHHRRTSRLIPRVVKSITGKYVKSVTSVKVFSAELARLTEAAGEAKVQAWTQLEAEAQGARGLVHHVRDSRLKEDNLKRMEIYDVAAVKGDGSDSK